MKLKPEKISGLNGIRTHDLYDTGAVQSCQYVFHIFITYFTFYGYITSSQCDQLPDGLIAQLVEHCTGIAEVMGSNPVQG